MIKLTIIAALLSISTFIKAQQDTLFFTENWYYTVRDSAKYYRIIVDQNKKIEVKDYYITDVLKMTGTYTSMNPESKEGYFKYYNKGGFISYEGQYSNNLKEGIFKDYDTLGKLQYLKPYSKNLLHGELTGFFENGAIRRQETYSKGEMTAGKCFDVSGNEIAFFPEAERSQFVGGHKEMMKFISQNLIYPEYALYNDIQGKVWVRFIVDTNGKISDIKVTRSVHPVLDAAAIEVLLQMPLWIPGKWEGQAVKSYFDLPINFVMR